MSWTVVLLGALDFLLGVLLYLYEPQFLISGEAISTGVLILVGGRFSRPAVFVGTSFTVSGSLLSLWIATAGTLHH